MRAQQGQVSGAAAEFMKDTPMYQLYQRVAPRPEDFPRLLDKIGELMSKDFDLTDRWVSRDDGRVDVEAVTAEATRPVRRPVLVQRWHDLTFVHWAVDPSVVAPLLPPGTRPDLFDGRTYVGLIGFRMVGLGLLSGPGLPYLGTFCETNVRLYSVDEAGRRAVVFLSLDASRLLAVLAAQVSLRLPYKWSRMRLRRDGGVRSYTCRRRWPGPRGAASVMSVRVGSAIAEPSPLEHFLTARWGLHVRAYGRTLHMPNTHQRWPLHRAELLALDDELMVGAGLPAPGTEPVSVLYSPGLSVRFGAPSTVQ